MSFLLRLVTPTIEDREKADGSAFMWSDYADFFLSYKQKDIQMQTRLRV